MSSTVEDTSARLSPSFHWAGYTLGFAIGGFFDGILLHQVLQWHHLLSGLEGGRFGDLRFQILADGFFHLLMYVIALAGLVLLWRTREEFARPRADRVLFANALIGFGAWHVIDGIVSHWVLGIHRIRMDSDNPLLWDLLWFFLFGVAFIIAGWLVRPPGGTARSRRAAPAMLAALAILLGGAAATPPADTSAVVVVFRPGVSPGQAMEAVARVDGRLLWSDRSDQVWAIDLPDRSRAMALYRGGAMIVSGTILPAACIDWIRT